MRELREYKKYKNRALVSKVNEGVFMNNYFVLLWKMQKQKHFRCAQNEFKLYVFETCKVAKRFFSLFMQFHSMPVEELELAELSHCRFLPMISSGKLCQTQSL